MPEEHDNQVPPEIMAIIENCTGGLESEFTMKAMVRNAYTKSIPDHKKTYEHTEVEAALKSLRDVLVGEYNIADPQAFDQCLAVSPVPDEMTPAELESLIDEIHHNLVTAGFLPDDAENDLAPIMLVQVVGHTQIDWIREAHYESNWPEAS